MLLAFFLIFLIFISSPFVYAQDFEIFLLKPLENGLKYLEKVEPEFYLSKDDTFRIKVYVEPKKIKSTYILSRKVLPLEKGKVKSRKPNSAESKNFTFFFNREDLSPFVWEYDLPQGLDLFDYNFLVIPFRKIGQMPRIEAKIVLDTEDETSPWVELWGIYPFRQKPLFLISEEEIKSKSLRPKTFSYLVKRELGLKGDSFWHYAEENGAVFLQKRVSFPLSKVSLIRLCFKEKTRFVRVNLYLDRDGNGRKDLLVLWEQIPHKIEEKDGQLVVELDLAKYLSRHQEINPKTARIEEIIVVIWGNKEEVLTRLPFQKIKYFHYNFSSDSQKEIFLPGKILTSGDKEKIVFDLLSALGESGLYTARIKKLSLRIYPEGEGFFKLYPPSLEDHFSGDAPIFLTKGKDSLKEFLDIETFPEEFVKKFKLLWWERPEQSGKVLSTKNFSFYYGYFKAKDCVCERPSDSGLNLECYFNSDEAFLRFYLRLPFQDLSFLALNGFSISGPVKAYLEVVDSQGYKNYPLKPYLTEGRLFLPGFLFKDASSVSFLFLPEDQFNPWEIQWNDFETNFFKIDKFSAFPEQVSCCAPYKVSSRQFTSPLKGTDLYLRAIYEGDGFLLARLKGKSQEKDFFLPRGIAVKIPTFKDGIKKIELWSYPNPQKCNQDFISCVPLKIKDVFLASVKLDLLKAGTSFGDLVWVNKHKIFDLLPENPPCFLLSEEKTLKVKLPAKLRTAFFPERICLRYHLGQQGLGEILLIEDNQKILKKDSLKQEGFLCYPLNDFQGKLPDEFTFLFRKTASFQDIPVFIDEIKVFAKGVQETLVDLAREDLRYPLKIDGRPLALSLEKDISLGEGAWLEFSQPLYLLAGSHGLTLSPTSYFDLKALVLEAQGTYSIPSDIISSEKRSPFEHLIKLIKKVLFLICFIFLVFLIWKRFSFVSYIKRFVTFLSQKYSSLPHAFWFFFWFVLSLVFYEKGFQETFKGENYWWTFGGIWIVLAYHHFIYGLKKLLQDMFPRVSKYLYRGPGTPYVSGFIFILLFCAILLVFSLEPLANQLAIIGYYLLVVGVLKELISFAKEKKSCES